MKFKKSQKFRLKLILISALFITFFFPSGAMTVNSARNTDGSQVKQNNLNPSLSSNEFIYSLNGKNYIAEYITEETVKDMKKEFQSIKNQKISNLIIDGHGTGYAPKSREEFDSLVGKIAIKESLSDELKESTFGATADLSEDIYFPVVGNQGLQGSCAAWATTYYAYGYLEAKDNGWDASSGNPEYLLSPSWTYNKFTPYDYGSTLSGIGDLMLDWGVSTLANMPYDDTTVEPWGNETAWREAPYHRPDGYSLISYSGQSSIDSIKSLLDGGTPVSFAIDADQFSNGLNGTSNDYTLTSEEYDDTGNLNHAQCFVGYNDSISQGGETGAFKVVNSWGSDWMDGGYYWITYDALNEIGYQEYQEIVFFTDKQDYNPNLIATWEFSSSPTRMQNIIDLGVGPHSTPLDTLKPQYNQYENDSSAVFPEFMAIDVSQFQDEYDSNSKVSFYLEVGESIETGTISSFHIERYREGSLQETSPEALNTPEDTPGYAVGGFQYDHELKAELEVPKVPEMLNSYLINSTVCNIGSNTESNVNLSLYLNNCLVNSTTISSLVPGSNKTVTYEWTPKNYGEFNFTAYIPAVSGERYLSNNRNTKIIDVPNIVFSDDFEDGLSKWSKITGLWHLANESSEWSDPYHTPTHSMWFGKESTGDYDTGGREIGNLTTNPFSLVNYESAHLEFYHWREGEVDWDYSYIDISTDGTHWNQIYSTDSSISPWERIFIDISNYVGNTSIQIRFQFDTTDSVNNNYRGWYIDDIEVWGSPLNTAPYDPTNPEPSNGERVGASPTLRVDVSDVNEDELTVTFYDASDDSFIGTETISGGWGTASTVWSGLPNGVHNWYAIADDGFASTQSPTWSFNTNNTAPDAPKSPTPLDEATGVSITPTLSLDVSDPDDDYLTVKFYNALDDSKIGTDTVSGGSGTASIDWSGLSEGTDYKWYAIADDGSLSTKSSNYLLTTNFAPEKPSKPLPTDGATGVSINPTLSVDVSDSDGEDLTVTFYNASDNSILGTDTVSGGNGTASINLYGLSEGTDYEWYVIANDSSLSTESSTYIFETQKSQESTPPQIPGYNLLIVICTIAIGTLLLFKKRLKKYYSK